MFGRRQVREGHEEAQTAAVSFLAHAARRAEEGLKVNRAVLARAAEARQTKRRSVNTVRA